MEKKKKKEFKFFWEEAVKPEPARGSIKKIVSKPIEFRISFPKIAAPNIKFQGIGSNIPISINKTDKEILIRAEMPGFRKNEINLNLTETTLDIKAVKKEKTIERAENFVRQESSSGSLRRTFMLPERVNPEKAKAKLEDGLLTIKIPRSKEEKKKKRIEIK